MMGTNQGMGGGWALVRGLPCAFLILKTQRALGVGGVDGLPCVKPPLQGAQVFRDDYPSLGLEVLVF